MWTVEKVRNRSEIDVSLLLTGNDVRFTFPKQCELSHFEHTFQYWFIMMMSVFRTSDSEGDMGVSSGRHARHYTRYTWALKTAFFPQVHNDDEVRALFMLLSNSSNCVFRTSDSEGDMGVSSGRHARHYTRYTWVLETAFFPQVHNDDEVRALFMLLSNSSNCVFRTSDSEGDMGVSSGRHARHYTRYTWALETAFFPQLCELV
ncbi:uncharacterized protein LOC107612883 isoform X3 [Arachis ipaensis]|uniref:uncharacterized protein LOC107612883 isoform X3 n=1 Tax=Arachis ipaensis TaxID=130454 RepID=UPI000A2B31BC|nr:uncharacterized protein LOC107612883 isoform X3 [Arachis ipaensis]XP_029150641.1 uncharacterized protein LOC112769134 isoform X5 [Arachis hypogaea]XP_029150642.1 uncharacterized protein LOC112769134 isoform X5 [Arachis hypogaea]XP_029150643.1 uncharacterized protein LOC112769134 isoform X5 [Arachis hypogaea]XP_029150644.1 uncharacterized protein LOC112769134 isoform X5 [Arachis hypogaea]XP_029150645.1 uncharacterized protein LOC112769134 isoform X5 [Arachis hypogaea]XP_029150646.1 uncharac